MRTENWSQGNWNAWVVWECNIAESRKRCSEVPNQFKTIAISHAETYWKIQGQARPRKRSFAGMSDPYRDWVCLEMGADDLEYGKQQLAKVRASGKTAPDQDFGQISAGFAGERVVDRWLTEKGISHKWNNNPNDPLPDFEFDQVTVDLKTHVTLGPPKKHYQTNVTADQVNRSGGNQDWYLFGKLEKSRRKDFWVLGFLKCPELITQGKLYREGETTESNMYCRCDCWSIEYNQLANPDEWLEKLNGKT